MEWTVVKKISTPDFDIEAGAAKIGEDILLYIQGGDKPHIGCTVMAVPRPSLSGNGERSVTSSVMNLTGHKDESICRMLAEDVCRTCGKTVVCTGGVHLGEYYSGADKRSKNCCRAIGRNVNKRT